MIIIAPRSSMIASAVKKTFSDIGILDPSPAITQTVSYIPKAHNLKAKATSMIYETIKRLFASRCYTRRIR